jgi:hypothetical protein
MSVVSRPDGLLIAEQRESLERDGYLLVPSLLDELVLAPMRARLDELVYQTLAAWDAGPARDVEERGAVRVNLGLSDSDFAPCREHPLLAEAAVVVLGPHWRVGGLALRAAAWLRPSGIASRLLPGPSDARAVAQPVGHVVHQRIHPG